MSAKFMDGKDDGALRTIGEVSGALGIKTHVLRYWEQQFPSLQPLKRSGRRYYRSEDIALLETIDRLVNREGYTLKGAQQALKDGKTGDKTGEATSAPPERAAQPDPASDSVSSGSVSEAQADSERQVGVPADVIAQIKAIRARLAAAIA